MAGCVRGCRVVLLVNQSSVLSSERDDLLKQADDEATAEIEALRAQRQAEYDVAVANSRSGDASNGAALEAELQGKLAAVREVGQKNMGGVLEFLTQVVAEVNISADPATRTKAAN